MGHNASRCTLLSHYSTISNYECQHMSPVTNMPLTLFEWGNIAVLAPTTGMYKSVSWTAYLEQAMPHDLLKDFAAAYNLSLDAYKEILELEYEVNRKSYTYILVDIYSYSRLSGYMCWPKVKLRDLALGYRTYLGALVSLSVPKHSLYGKWTAKAFPSAPLHDFWDNHTFCMSPDDPYFRDVHAVINLEMGSWHSFKTDRAAKNMETAAEIFMPYSHPFLKAFGKSFRESYSCSSLKGCPFFPRSGEAWIPQDMWRMEARIRELLDQQLPVCIMLGYSEPPEGFYTINSFPGP
ncbi:hypothetical protein CP533_0971 [Ophiocordyceps camponoti-saundersi (nom. inval.)]|nr:hypothetical protein CP533_0971 [Ophiocordyceps camponoti-saundersi (nom. inval.)]